MISRFLGLDTVDSYLFFCVSVLCTVGCLASSLALPTRCQCHSPKWDNQNIPKHCQMSPRGKFASLHPHREPLMMKLRSVRCLQTARCPDVMDGYRAFHMYFLFAAAINISICICNFGHSLAGKTNGGKANILL